MSSKMVGVYVCCGFWLNKHLLKRGIYERREEIHDFK